MGVSSFGIVDHKKWDRRDDWNGQFVSPSYVKDIIEKTKDGCNEERKKRRKINRQLASSLISEK